MFKKSLRVALIATTVWASAGTSNAALIGVVQSYPDATLVSSNTLIYDRNAIDANTGLLLFVSGGATLSTGPGGSGQVTQQNYLGDTKLDQVLSFAINNTTGQLVANSTWNKVTIGLGTVTAPNWQFSWQGNITRFGFDTVGSTNVFDARWTTTADQYVNVPSALQGTFSDGRYAGYTGGIKFSSQGASGTLTGSIWSYDWIRGMQAGTENGAFSNLISNFVGTTRLAAYQNIDIATSANREVTTVTGDVFLPVPASGLLLLSGLAALGASMVRRRLVDAGQRPGAALAA